MENIRKFSIGKFGQFGERLGFWELSNHAPIPTPGLWITTGATGIPHLTPETFEISGLKPDLFSGLMASFEKHARSVDVYEAYGKGFLSFCGIKQNFPVLISVYDPSTPIKSGFSNANSVSVWGECNQRHSVSIQDYLSGISALKPDAFIVLHNGDVKSINQDKISAKKIRKITEFNQKSLRTMIEKAPKDCAVVGVIEAFNSEADSKFLKDSPVGGYLLDGFHTNGDSALNMNKEFVLRTLKDTIVPNVSQDKPKFFLGMCDPKTVIELVKNGVDFFETSYVYHLSDQGLALCFPNALEKNSINEDLSTKHNENGKGGDCDEIKNGSKFVTQTENLNLNESIYKNDFKPLVDGCMCFCCRKHTRAYINHLLGTKELLASVLLVIHNLHHYGIFFRSIRKAISEDQLNELSSLLD